MNYPIRAAPTGPLPKQQAKVIAFIDAEIGAGRPFPSAEKIANHMGWRNAQSAYDCMHRLAWRGELWVTAAKKFERI